MGQDPRQERAQQQLTSDREKSPAELRAEIEDVRSDLGETAAALAAKTDVKTRARERAAELKRSVTAKKDDLMSRRSTPGGGGSGSEGAAVAIRQARTKAEQNPVLVAALGALIGGFTLGRLTRRDR